jgi:heme-degrading monooxygenase HmoA
MLLLVDRDAERNVAINLWESEADLDAFLRDASTPAVLGHRHFAAGEVGDERFEVAEYTPGTTPGAARHARVATFDVQPGRMDDQLRHSAERMRPVVEAQPGFQGRLILVDRARDRTMVVTLWESEAACRAAFEHPAVRQAHPHPGFGAGALDVALFEVAHQE